MSNHIDHIEITNFKSIRHQKIEGCKRINVFIGYPNVGKSNILEAIGLFGIPLLRNGESFFLNDIVRLEHFSELFFNRDYRPKFSASLFYKKNDSQETEIELIGNTENNSPILKIDFKQFTHESATKSHFVSDNSINGKAVILAPDHTIDYSAQHKNISEHTVRKYDYASNITLRSSNNFALSIPHGKNLIDLLQGNLDIGKESVDLFKSYGLKIFLETDNIFLTKELSNGISVRIPYHQMADTLRRLIFYKAAIMSNHNSALLFEEPEAHMFPPYIRKFTGDIIFDKDNNNQYFINTHSPFVIEDFLEDAREDLSVYLVGLKNGETTIKRLSDEELQEVYQYGVDLFYNIESYLD